MTWYWHSINVDKPCIFPWIYVKTKFNCHIKFLILFGELLFSKRFVVIKHDSNQSSSVPNNAKLIIHAIDKLKTDFVMAKTTAISLVKNTIKQLHIQSDLNLIHKKVLS